MHPVVNVMADRFPLIVNPVSKKIEELVSGDNLNLTGNGLLTSGSTGVSGQYLKSTGTGLIWDNPGDVYLTDTQTLTNKTFTSCTLSGSTNTVSDISNNSLQNSSITINGSSISLGGSFDETDPIFTASVAFGITSTQISNWDTAYGWGDHGLEGYLTSYTETDPIFTASVAFGITSTQVSNWDTAYGWGDHGLEGYLTSYTETDPIFTASVAFGITSTQISNWDTAYGWGDHATEGYLTSYTETDPIFTASVAFGITSTQVSNWDTAYGWGDHATEGYLTSYTETSTLDDVTDRGSSTTNSLAVGGLTINNGNLTVDTNTLFVDATNNRVSTSGSLLSGHSTALITDVYAGSSIEVGGSTYAKLALTTGTTNRLELFYDSANGYISGESGTLNIRTTTESDLTLGSNSITRVTVLSGGDVTLNTGNLVIGTSGKGIDFSAAGNAAGMTSELLDDYEEGTWTPSVGGTATYNTQTGGTYTKIGNLVYCSCRISINVLGTGSATAFGGLPFTPSQTGSINAGGGVSYYNSSATSVAFIGIQISTGSNNVLIVGTSGAQANITNGVTFFQNGTDFIVSFFYKA
jgi:hypothetical protein